MTSLFVVRSQTVSMRIPWCGQHQFLLITAVSQAGRETGSAIANCLHENRLACTASIFTNCCSKPTL
ncbi:hypothetical protein LC608_26890 [Nostoc sp. XA010]|uniref:hypothetical protein n=1 Tax=Nostoc sp. XA010 TaxID=2780407 RepID=UPI001E33FD9C|nr:hypothetical protein [Nostoc sp. XA010]MCC5660540.1 hypothetical protein [Nostoc sp. XA010]